MLPPAGQIFEKWHLLGIIDAFANFFEFFKQGASRSAASGAPFFEKWHPLETNIYFLNIFLICSR